MIPRRPAKNDDDTWLEWVKKYYPFDVQWEHRLLHRRERPTPGSEAQLEDLRGVRIRQIAASLARLWFDITANSSQIAEAQKAEKTRDAEKERARLIRIAKLALEGKLGDTAATRDTAQATARSYINNHLPEFCDSDTLTDWEKMHQYTKRLALGENPPKPKLSAEIRAEQARRREMADIHESIGAYYGAVP